MGTRDEEEAGCYVSAVGYWEIVSLRAEGLNGRRRDTRTIADVPGIVKVYRIGMRRELFDGHYVRESRHDGGRGCEGCRGLGRAASREKGQTISPEQSRLV